MSIDVETIQSSKPERTVDSYVSCTAIVYLLLMLPVLAQTQTFVTINIQHSRPPDLRNASMHVSPNGDLFANAVPVITLLSFAYDVPINPSPRLFIRPGWNRDKYDIQAKASDNAIPIGLGDEEKRRREQIMIRGLLTDRFGLVMRVESKRMAVYALSVANGGPKLNKSLATDKECIFDTSSEGCHTFSPGFGHPLQAKAVDMDDLAHYIENWTDLPVVNHTVLNGLFTVHTEGWRPMRLPPPPPGATPAVNPFAGLPTIFTVLGRLGLELKAREAAVPVYTVDHLEPPARIAGGIHPVR